MSGQEIGKGQNSAGLLILGMHRSGTSALSALIHACGADPGLRVTGVGVGNERGHWEDAFAVERHEQLLASLGTRWDEPFSLPAGWQSSESAKEAKCAISLYITQDRARHRLWSLKDPRLCLLGDLWIDAAAVQEIPLGAVLLIRHPLEVAASLAARDGTGLGRGLLVWLDYTVAAVARAERLPSVVMDYESLLHDWKGCIRRIASLPGATDLARDLDKMDPRRVPDLGLRHQRAVEGKPMPRIIEQAWEHVLQLAVEGRVGAGSHAWLRDLVAPARELLQPMLGEWKTTEAKLWSRVARAEESGQNQLQLQSEISELKQGMEKHHVDLIQAVTNDLKHMQTVTAAALAQAEAAKREAALSQTIEPVLRVLERGQDSLYERIQSRFEHLERLLSDERSAVSDWTAGAENYLKKMTQDVENMRRTWGAALSEHKNNLLELLEMERTRIDPLEARIAALTAKLSDYHVLAGEREQLQRTLTEQARSHEAELDSLRYDVRRLNEKAALLDQVVASRSWRWTRPLRFLRRLLGGQMQASDRAEVRRMLGLSTRNGVRQSVVAASSHGATLPVLAEYSPGLPDVFVWAVIDWHFRFQRPQHLAQALARKGHRVFYVSNNLLDSDRPGFSVEPLDAGERLFQVNLHLAGAPAIYHGMPDSRQAEGLRASFAKLLGWTQSPGTISIVQHPFWSELARIAPNGRVVYDCMDHHAGFENNAPAVLAAEEDLIRSSELVIVTSEWLEKEIAPRARSTSVLRNAGEYEFFCHRPNQTFKDPKGRKVIGYYGAIAEWFDLALLRAAAEALPGALFVLVGHDTAGAASALGGLDNVKLVGEVPYQELPFWLHGFDVCLLPFKIMPLTLATNPVKVYEYLSAGKPTVVVDLPEMKQFDGLVSVTRNTEEFIAGIRSALDETIDGPMVEKRQNFGSQQTWKHRAEALDDAIESVQEPLVSVIVLTYNNLTFTEACLFSIEAYSDYRNLEVIVVDNASSDGSREWLERWANEPSAAGHQRRLILNQENLGFSAGNNVGLRAASGEYLIILNNDTYVTPGWVRTLCAHLRHNNRVGLVGPVTNNIGNEARLEIAYSDMIEMIRLAGEYTRSKPGCFLRIRTAAFFCVAMRRQVYSIVGDMDEDFGVGFFEDDDYCRRVQNEGLDVICVDDVFVHHHLSASFDKLRVDKKKELFERNKAIYEAKWGSWVPHAYRQQ